MIYAMTCVLWPWAMNQRYWWRQGTQVVPNCSRMEQTWKGHAQKLGRFCWNISTRTSGCSWNPRNSADFHRLQGEPNQYLCQRSHCGNHVAMLMPRQAALALADIAEATHGLSMLSPGCSQNHWESPASMMSGSWEPSRPLGGSIIGTSWETKIEPAFWPNFMLASQSLSCLFIKYFQKLM